MAKADLTAARLRELLHYDPDTGAFTRKVSIRQFKAGEVAGFQHNGGSGYWAVKVQQRIYLAHRLAWLYVHGEWPAGQIDHLNQNGMDNRIGNLRDVSGKVNAQNERRARPQNRCGFLGVTEDTRSGTFTARIKVDRKSIHLGSFPTPEAAHTVYVEAKRRLHEGCTI